MRNINTKYYWDLRFSTGDWESKRGRNQTKQFALSQIPLLGISRDFSGTILDFGCGLGDAFPIYKASFPNANLIELDISKEAIKKCKESYGNIGEFICGSFTEVPMVDIIIASNVFEHITDDKLIALHLIKKCKQVNIIVPFQEQIVPNAEHINSYSEEYFDDIGQYQYKIFTSKGWGNEGFKLYYHIYLKNILRPIFGKPLAKRAKQIIFKFNKF